MNLTQAKLLKLAAFVAIYTFIWPIVHEGMHWLMAKGFGQKVTIRIGLIPGIGMNLVSMAEYQRILVILAPYALGLVFIVGYLCFSVEIFKWLAMLSIVDILTNLAGNLILQRGDFIQLFRTTRFGWLSYMLFVIGLLSIWRLGR